ncbi:unnamed protein product [Caenorhabditis bovis]|uniref:USP domain-containing protein n=1 Tax=Caenorhabditis bovis TaxID=2654633 RepID=A0A8S1EUE6_9PELO|nr:unnamed protein product [Caenorhabditis bovis]
MATPTTSKGNEWRYLTTVPINPTLDTPISVITFDPYEELLWCGSSAGKVASFTAAQHFNRYSAFVSTRLGAVNALEVTEEAVFSLTDVCLRSTTRQGIPISKYMSPSMTHMKSLYRVPNSSIFVMGGEQEKLIQFDYAKEKEIRTTQMKENSAVLIRSNNSNLFIADTNGYVNVKNPKTLETIQRIPCHSERITDFDVQGNKLITCGISQRHTTSHGDPFVKVFDLRTYKALAPIPLAFPPHFCKFMPSYCERIVVASQTGGVRIWDLNSNNIGTSLIVESNGISAMNFSSTKQYMAFGDFSALSIYADRNEPQINAQSYETVFAYAPIGPPVSFGIEDNFTPLAAVPMPFTEDDTLLSDWPSEMTQPMYRRSRPVGEHSDVKVMHYVTQVKNPRINSKLRNQNIVPYILEDEPDDKKNVEIKIETGKVRVHRLYKKCPLTTSATMSARRIQPKELKFSYSYNKTNHVPLETTYYMNLLINPFVLALYHIIGVRNTLYAHFCTNEHCIACDLRFLFAMITDRAKSSPVVSTNLVRTLVAHGFTTLKTNVVTDSYAGMNLLLRGISEAAFDLESQPESETCLLSDDERTVLRTDLTLNMRCVRCCSFQSNPCQTHYVTLNYNTHGSPSFCTLIEKALHLVPQLTDERECPECSTTTRMDGKQRVRSLAPILIIDTNAKNDQFFSFWQRQLAAYEKRPPRDYQKVPESPTEKKSCRYGDDCLNKSCKFAHGKIDWDEECTTILEDCDDDGWSHYLCSKILVQVNDGIVRLNDASTSPSLDDTDCDVYELVAFVTAIGTGEYPPKWTHTVSLVKDEDELLPWTMINEQLVSRLHENEALHLDARWKLPMMLAYVNRKHFDAAMRGDEKRTPVPESVFFSDNLAPNTMTSSGDSSKYELPGKGELVGIDAEFIRKKCKFDSDSRGVITRAIGRISCVDSTGNRIIFDDHVQVTDGECVADYLTRYSGIVSDDLNAQRSSKYLTTQKRVFLKIMVLIERGCIFVGHALNNDFSVLNIHVPDEQIIDTVNLFRLDSQRLLSLQLLAFQLLGDKIQEESHDSVVDAQYAMKVYRKYEELKQNGQLKAEMRRLYDVAPCSSPMKSVSPCNSTTSNK